jgi:hypothetical protein
MKVLGSWIVDTGVIRGGRRACAAQYLCMVVLLVGSTVLFGGCGGGASGTGGLSGDLDPVAKIGSLSDSDKQVLCQRVVRFATRVARADRRSPVFRTQSELFQRYRRSSDGSPRDIFDQDQLSEGFANETPESLERECEDIFQHFIKLQEERALCGDAGSTVAEIGWNPTPEDLRDLQITGPCDLDDPNLAQYDITVQEYFQCLVSLLPSLKFSPESEIVCSQAHTALQENRPELLLSTPPSLQQSARRRAREAVCGRVIRDPMLRTNVEATPLVCVDGLDAAMPFLVSLSAQDQPRQSEVGGE